MGLRFRKSINIGPLRINFSKSGIGFSLGVKGFRVSRSAKGKMSATASLPGTGLSYVQNLDAKSIKKTVDDVKDLFDGDDNDEKKKD
jgi:hypothetical protein